MGLLLNPLSNVSLIPYSACLETEITNKNTVSQGLGFWKRHAYRAAHTQSRHRHASKLPSISLLLSCLTQMSIISHMRRPALPASHGPSVPSKYPNKFKCNAPKWDHLHVPFLFSYIYHLTLWPSLTNGTQRGSSWAIALPRCGTQGQGEGCHKMTQTALGVAHSLT